MRSQVTVAVALSGICLIAATRAHAQPSCATSASTAANLSREEADSLAKVTIADARDVTGDYHRCRTLAVALMQVRSVTTARLFFDAATALEGQYELAELLVASAERGLLEERTADAFFRATRQLSDDFQHARVLGAALRAGAKNPHIVRAILRSAPGIADDFQLASVLIAVARAAPVTAETRVLYGAAARTLQNQWEYRRAMGGLTP